ncbi:sensor histidine kinase [Bacterioplanoides sp.]|uniref:sensor histidine kinase n=1 Tax=Bacterioplanoides sp. TaxID=2066072 RepID=UPI003AFFDBB4
MDAATRRLTAAILIYMVGIIAVAFISYMLERQRYLEDIDARLYAAASNLPGLLPEDFHDIARTADAISPEQDRENLELLTRHAKTADMTYIYSYVMVDGEIYFTTCNYTEDDIKNDQVVTYWTDYPEGAQKYYDAMYATEPVYVTAGDRWGLFRTILLPLKSPGGLPYVAAADMDITVIEQALIDDMLYVFGFSLLLAFIVAPLIWAYHKTHSEMNTELRGLNRQLQDDIHQAKILEKELKQATQIAEDASKVKSQFLSNMSHELRTPINGILGVNQLLLDTRLDDEQREFTELSAHSAQILLDTVNQILDTAAIEANGLVLRPEVVDSQRFFNDLSKMFSAQVAAKKLDLVVHLGNDLPAQLEFDAVRLRQVFINLIANALKFTSEGGVSICVHWLDGVLSAEVRDTGIGIPEDAQQSVFEIFHQIDNSHSRQHAGNGLGLSIAQKICELMQGSLRLEQSSADGSLFSFTVQTPSVTRERIQSLSVARTSSVLCVTQSALLSGWLDKESQETIHILPSTEQISLEGMTHLLVDNSLGDVDWASLVSRCQQASVKLIALMYAGEHLDQEIEAQVQLMRKPLTRKQLSQMIQ